MKKLALTLSILALALGANTQNAAAQDDGAQDTGTQDAGAQAASYNAPQRIGGNQFDTPDIDFDKIDQQGPRWHFDGVGGVTMSQVSLSNWAAGGEGSLAFDAMLNYDAVYTNRRHLWQNRLELAYGLSNSKSQKNRKTNDKIFLSSMYGYRLSRTWYASALGLFSTQFARGFDYTANPRRYISRFMAPGYLGFGVGATWKPVSWFSAYLSPATWRGTFVLEDQLFMDGTGAMVYSPYGVAPGKKLRNEFGANIRLEVNRDLWTNFHIYSRLDLFSNYLHKPQNIDVRWYVLAAYKINDWLGVNLSFNMLYDDNIRLRRPDGTMGGPKLQTKEVLGIGLQTHF